MNVILNPIGTTGDVNPFVGLGLALQARGHRVSVLANPTYEKLIAKVGLEYIPLGAKEDLQNLMGRSDLWRSSKGWQVCLQGLALDTMREVFQQITHRYEPGETVVVAPGHSFGARVAQEKLGVPLVTIHLEPAGFRSNYVSPVMPPPMLVADWVPRISKRLQFGVADRFIIDPFAAPPLNAWRDELDLPPARRILGNWWHSPQCVIGFFPAWFAPPQPDWPAATEVTEFPVWDQSATATAPPEVEEFLSAGDPPLVFTASSNKLANDFYSASAECCRLLGRRGMLIGSDLSQMPPDLPDTVRPFSYVPFSYVLHRAAALVHHAGVGTAALALAAGIPQIACPMIFSQPDTAQRLKRLGVSETVRPKAYRGPFVARTLERLLASPRVREQCRKYQQLMQAARPFERACELIEGLAGQDRLRPAGHLGRREASGNSVVGCI